MIQLSLIVITRNAEAHLARCLDSVPFATEKLVVDSGSTDRTVEVALSHGARVITEDWRGFGPQKRLATERAKCDWILSLDADEALSPESQEEIKTLLADHSILNQSPAYAFPRLSFHLGRWIRHGGWYPDWQIRLYDRRRTNWSEAQVHEKILGTEVKRLRAPIQHWVFTSLDHQVETNNRYSGLGTQELIARGRAFSLFNLLLKPKIKFLETYIWKRGFLDGMPGFIIAVGASYSVFLKWAKLWEKRSGS